MFILVPCPFCNCIWGCLLCSATKLNEFLVFFGYKSFIRYIVWKYFLSFHSLTFHFVGFLCCAAFQFDVVLHVYFSFCCLCLWCQIQKKSLPRWMSRSLLSMFSSRGLSFRSYIQVFNPFWVSFCVWFKIGVPFPQHHLLKRLMLKLKLQYFGHLMWRADSFEKTLMLGKIEGRRRRGWQRMRWLDGITDSMNVGLGGLRELEELEGGLVCCSSWGRKESDMTEWLNWTEPFLHICMALFLGSLFCSIDLWVCFMTISYCFECYTFTT